MNAARPFTTERFYPISLCAKFIEGLDPRLVPGFRRNFTKHSTAVMLCADIQRKTLQDMLVAAKRAKDDCKSVQQATREAVGLLQSFVSRSRGDTGGALAFPSQAGTTLTKYSSTGGSCGEKLPINCFGCGGPHPWSEYIGGKHVVKFSNRSNPVVGSAIASSDFFWALLKR